MSIDVNHYLEKKIKLRYGIAFGGLWSRSPEGGGGKAHQMRRIVSASFLRQLLGQQLPRALVLQRSHRLVIAPD